MCDNQLHIKWPKDNQCLIITGSYVLEPGDMQLLARTAFEGIEGASYEIYCSNCIRVTFDLESTPEQQRTILQTALARTRTVEALCGFSTEVTDNRGAWTITASSAAPGAE